MRISIIRDDELVVKAQDFTGIMNKSRLVHEVLKALVARESGCRLALLGGSEAELTGIVKRTN